MQVSLGLKKGVVYTGEVEGTLADTLKADVKVSRSPGFALVKGHRSKKNVSAVVA